MKGGQHLGFASEIGDGLSALDGGEARRAHLLDCPARTGRGQGVTAFVHRAHATLGDLAHNTVAALEDRAGRYVARYFGGDVVVPGRGDGGGSGSVWQG